MHETVREKNVLSTGRHYNLQAGMNDRLQLVYREL